MTEMKTYETIKAVYDGRKLKDGARVKLGLFERQVNRLVLAYRKKAFSEKFHIRFQKCLPFFIA